MVVPNGLRLSAVARSVIRDVEKICPGRVATNVSLAEISRWRIGGIADVIVSPTDTAQISALRRYLDKNDLRHVVIGATSNLLFSDDGLRVVCVQIGSGFASISVVGSVINASAGVWVPGLARRAMQAGLKGLEHTCGIPGTLGGLICMNGGSQRNGIGDVVTAITSVDTKGEIRYRTREDCAFNYRHSVFQTSSEIIAEAELRLQPQAGRRSIRREMLDILSGRRRKFPQKLPNCGSVFVSNPALYADYGPPGAVIERLGFKGKRVGGARVSPLHANFIVNEGGARTSDVTALIAEIKAAVMAHTGCVLTSEVRIVTCNGEILPADAADASSVNRGTSSV